MLEQSRPQAQSFVPTSWNQPVLKHGLQQEVRLGNLEHVGLAWHKYVVIDPTFKRPAEVDVLLGDAGKARQKLGWESKVHFPELVRMMVQADLNRCRALIRS